MIENKDRWNKNRKIIIVIFICIIGLCSLVIWGYQAFLKNGMGVLKLVKSYMEEPYTQMKLDIRWDTGQEEFSAQTTIYSMMVDEHRVFWLEQQGMKLYFANARLLLENGKAFQLWEKNQTKQSFLSQVLALCQSAKIDYRKDGQLETYRIAIHSLPESIAIEITAVLGKLQQIAFAGKSVEGILTVQNPAASEFQVSELVQEAVKEGKFTSQKGITKDIIRIIRAWGELNAREKLKADFELKASFNSLQINEDFEYYRVSAYEQEISSIRKNDFSVTFTPDGILGFEKITGDYERDPLVSMPQLIGLSYQLCLNGELSCEESENAYIYSVFLDETAMREMIYAVLPQTEEWNISPSQGRLQVIIQEDCLETVSFHIRANPKVLMSELDILIGTDITFQRDFDKEDIRIMSELAKVLEESGDNQ